jgi:hypothetical protein
MTGNTPPQKKNGVEVSAVIEIYYDEKTDMHVKRYKIGHAEGYDGFKKWGVLRVETLNGG